MEQFEIQARAAELEQQVNAYGEALKQQQEQWNTWFESQQGAIGAQRQIDIQATQPEGQVAGRIWIKTY